MAAGDKSLWINWVDSCYIKTGFRRERDLCLAEGLSFISDLST